MSISMYSASAPVLLKGLGNLKAILDKAAAHIEARKIDERVLLGSRLFPDMFDLTRQVQIASDFGQRTLARLAGMEVPGSEDKETSIAQLQARIDAAIAFVKAVPAERLEGSEERAITLQAGPETLNFTGLPYLVHFALPNFFFHLATAYNILRHSGVELGKRDFLGSM